MRLPLARLTGSIVTAALITVSIATPATAAERAAPGPTPTESPTTAVPSTTAPSTTPPGTATPSATPESPAADPALIIATDKGRVRGAYVQTRRSFQGIPFAAPPVGPLRWKSPAPAASWPGVRSATTPGSPCPQTGGLSEDSTNEDCLYLNVITPRTSARKLPVMVYIPGGGFTTGSGSFYNPAPLVDRGNVIVVTLNYRLGALGFLGLPALSAEGGTHKSGLYGIEDQQAAMAWVRRNIAAFGGDAKNVTVFGESAGAASSCIQLVSPLARGLFDRIAAESGCNLIASPLSEGEKQGSDFAAAAGCTTGDVVACLRGKPVADVLKNQSVLAKSVGPLYGGAALPDSVAALLAKGAYPRVPILQGANHDEGRFFVGTGQFGAITTANYLAVTQAFWGDKAAAIVGEYPTSAYSSPALAFATSLGDGYFACRALRAGQLIDGRTRLYEYEFNDATAPTLIPGSADFPLGATHTSELAYLFDLGLPLNASQQASANRLIAYWTNFARTGDPNGATVPVWPAYSPGEKLQSLETTTARPVSAADARTGHHCAFWQQLFG